MPLIRILLVASLCAPASALVVYWDPPAPAPGSTVTIFYNVIEGTLPDNTNPVYIHLGVNGWQDVHDHAMAPDTATGWWYYRYPIPADVTVIDFVFTDLQGNWDNNGGIGIDWHISLICSWIPFAPNPNDSVEIVVRSGGGHIVWFVRSGIHSLPPIPQYWPQGSSPTPDDEAVATPLSGPHPDGTYRAVIGPFTSARQVVDAVKFKILWADGTHDATLFEITADHTPLSGDPVVSILSPQPGASITETDILVDATDADAVEIWGGPDSLGTFTAPPYAVSWVPSPHTFGPVTVTAKGVGTEGRVSFDRVGVTVPPVVISRAAPAGITDGVTVVGAVASFALYAPAKDYVALKGSFNREYPNGELMYLSGDTLWWAAKRLSPGDYLYQYNIEGIKCIADPWSRDVTWVSPGTESESGSYEHAKTRFSVGASPFPWTDGGFVRPSVEEIVVYELHVGDFAGLPDGGIGVYADVMAKLAEGYFDSLGIHAVELMPVDEFEGANSWGYNPSFYGAPETTYGTPEQLKALVNEFHAHGIAVLVDVVFNHMWGSAPLFQLYQPLGDWNYQNHDYANCPYFHDQASQWGYKLQHWQEVGGRRYRTWKYVTDALRTWVQDYHIDGFRYDASWGVGWDGYNANGMSFYTWYMRELDPGLIQIVEEDNASRVNSTEADAGWNFSYFHAMKANLQQINDSGHTWGNMIALANELSYSSQGFQECYGPLNYVESHDETRIIYEAMTYQGMDYPTALKKSRLGAAVLLTGTGTPMIYHGQEFAQNATSRNPDGGIIPQPLQWQNLSTPSGYALFQHYRRLIWLRATHEIIRSPSFQVTSRSNTTKHIVFWRGDAGTEQQIVVAANFDTADHLIGIEFPGSGTWYEFTEDDSLEVQGGYSPVYNLPASTARIFVNARTWPMAGEGARPVPSRITLAQNHPNPASVATVISYSLPSPCPAVRIEIHDLLGRRVRLLLQGSAEAGRHETLWDLLTDSGALAPSGVYLCMLHAEGRVATRRLVVAR
ncbi:T9SS type A sorting domain-containing protein [Candidatus Fermentibacteria bacterium]|nr:T9SS type A sorting domain-containing protein [Candidatus Fermentibacteria bacterium]